MEIDLLVRGICCLRPGVPGISERIRVSSVVDRFLEHSRVFAFGSPDRVEIYLSSADWMPRNFQRRIEVMFPVEDPLLRERLYEEILGAALKDNSKARHLRADGSYTTPDAQGEVRSQLVLLEAARRAGEPKPLEPLRHVAAPDLPVEPLRLVVSTPNV